MKPATAAAIKPARKLKAVMSAPLAAVAAPVPGAMKLAQKVVGMSEYDICLAKIAVEAILVGDEEPITSPVEYLIWEILDSCRVDGGLTPEGARKAFEGFTMAFNQMREASRKFIDTYGMVS
jgi:hypothetical protein